MQSYLFQTGSIASPASRELHSVALCEHLHQNLFWACISRIHAQVPLVTSGKLTESLHQQIPCGIDVSVVGYLAFRARPIPHVQPQLIE
jgi:primosomal replication protein N